MKKKKKLNSLEEYHRLIRRKREKEKEKREQRSLNNDNYLE